MDRMPVCGIGDPGSIPGGSTNTKKSTRECAFFVCARTVLSGRQSALNRSLIELRLEAKRTNLANWDTELVEFDSWWEHKTKHPFGVFCFCFDQLQLFVEKRCKNRKGCQLF